MQKIKTFLRAAYRSATQPNYYLDVVRAPFSFSLKYFLCLSVLLAIAYAIDLGVTSPPKLSSFLAQSVAAVRESFPEELEIEIQDGKVSINTEEPYYVKLEDDSSREESSEGDLTVTVNGQVIDPREFENLLVIDTQAQIEDLETYQTMALLTENRLCLISDEDGEIRCVDLGGFDGLKINKSWVENFLQTVSPFIPFVDLALIALIVSATVVFYPLAQLVANLFGSLVIWLISVISKAGLSYSKSYQMGLHARTLPIVLEVILNLSGVSLPFQGTILFLAFLAITGLGVRQIKNQIRPGSDTGTRAEEYREQSSGTSPSAQSD